MKEHDIRLVDMNDPNTPSQVLKEITKTASDATDKFETFVVTHEPINLKAKLAGKKRVSAPQPYVHVEEDEEIIDEDYTDDDEGTA